jgi:hypothetical protein
MWVAAELIRIVHDDGVPSKNEPVAKKLQERYSKSRPDGWAPDISLIKQRVAQLLGPVRKSISS